MLAIIGGGFYLFQQIGLFVISIGGYFFLNGYVFNYLKKNHGLDLNRPISGFRFYEIIHIILLSGFLFISVSHMMNNLIDFIYMEGEAPLLFHVSFFILLLKIFSFILYKIVFIFRKRGLIYLFLFINLLFIAGIQIQAQSIWIEITCITLFINEILFFLRNIFLNSKIDKYLQKIGNDFEMYIDKIIYIIHYIIPGLGLFTMKGIKYKILNFPIFFIFILFYSVIFISPSILVLHGILLILSVFILRNYNKRIKIIKI